MKKIFIVLAALFLLVPGVTFAATLKAENGNNSTNVAQSETVKNAYLAGNSVNFSGTALQDVVAAGNNMNITGSIGSSLMIAGNNITISGPVGQSVRAAGNNINMQNSIGSDLFAAGSTITLGQGVKVADDFDAAAAAIDIAGKIGGNANLTGAEINLNGEIDGNVLIKGAGKVTIGSGAVINGNLNYEATEPATISEGAKINGQTNFTKVESMVVTDKKMGIGVIAGIISLFSLGVILVTFLTIWFLVALMPKLARSLVENSLAKPTENMGLGFAYLVVTPIAAVFLLFTVVGIPLSLLVFGIYGVAVAIAKLIVPIIVGSLLFKWFGKTKSYRIDWLTILVGVVVAAIVGAIPLIGNLALALVFFMVFAQIINKTMDFVKSQK